MAVYDLDLQELPLFAGLKAAEVDQFIQATGARVKRYGKHTRILKTYEHNDKIGIIAEGEALVIAEDRFGNESVGHRLGRGALFGSTSILTLSASDVAVCAVMSLLVLAVVVLEIFRGGSPSPLHILKEIARNPLIIGAVLGILTVPFHIVLPDLVEDVVFSLKDVATPMALVILGMSLNLRDMGEEKRNLVICVLGRLVIVPAAALTVGALIGLRGVSFVTLIAVFASPTAVSSFTMAEQMDSNGQLAANAVVFSSALASLTMFCWIFLFKSLGTF